MATCTPSRILLADETPECPPHHYRIAEGIGVCCKCGAERDYRVSFVEDIAWRRANYGKQPTHQVQAASRACADCGVEAVTLRRGICPACVTRRWRETHPEYKPVSKGICPVCGERPSMPGRRACSPCHNRRRREAVAERAAEQMAR